MYKSILLCFIFLTSAITTMAQDFDQTISTTADTLAKKIISSKRNTVAITDFINLDGSITQLGTFLSEEISSELSNLTNNQTAFRVLERSKLDEIVKEKNLIQSTDGSKMATELGKLDVADVLIFATITDFNGYYRVVIKLLDTKNGDALSSCKVSFVKSPSLENLNQTVIKKSDETQINASDNSSSLNVSTPKEEQKPEYGDYCFKNTPASYVGSYDVTVDIYDKSNTKVKSINVTVNQTSCVYELPKGIYRIELTWHAYNQDLKKETKEIRVSAGKSDTIELVYTQ